MFLNFILLYQKIIKVVRFVSSISKDNKSAFNNKFDKWLIYYWLYNKKGGSVVVEFRVYNGAGRLTIGKYGDDLPAGSRVEVRDDVVYKL